MQNAAETSALRGRILVADDEPHIRRILKTVLESGSFEVDTRPDGTAALEAAMGPEHYDLILLDIMMPGATGLEVLEQIRGIERLKSIPVVILTAKGQDADRQAALSLGANDFLIKPFSPKKLLARITEILDEA
jgi:DNA-binding response OmpR family regulator